MCLARFEVLCDPLLAHQEAWLRVMPQAWHACHVWHQGPQGCCMGGMGASKRASLEEHECDMHGHEHIAFESVGNTLISSTPGWFCLWRLHSPWSWVWQRPCNGGVWHGL